MARALHIKKSVKAVVLAAALIASGSVMAQSSGGGNLFSSVLNSKASNPHSLYAKAGFLGAGVGYAYGIDRRFTLRGEFTTAGRFSHDVSVGDGDYNLRLKNDMALAALDYFPFENGFRLTMGVGVRNTKVSGDSNTFMGSLPGSGESAHASLRWPTVAPYLGIGWGHNNGQHAKGGWGFVADVGVYYGKPDYSLTANAATMNRLNAQSGGQGQALINEQRDKWAHEARKLRFFPVVQLGASYRF